MSRMVVIIDARRARQGADEFSGAQEQMRRSARRTQEDIERANQTTVASILAGLDREISRRQAVREAQARGVEEGRIEAKAQEVINGLRARGIVLSQQEIQQIREKTRASQELANAIEGTIRAARNQDQAQAIAGASHTRQFERATEGEQLGPITQEQHLEEVRRQTEKLSRAMNEARGWIGDVGDAFDYVGKQIFGFSDAQAQAIDTTLMITEKGMALGEVFGPTAALWGGVAGLALGAAAAIREETKARQALFREVDLYQKKLAEAVAETESQKYFERLYLGTEKVRISLGEIAKINVSNVTSQFEKLSKIKLGIVSPFDDATSDYERAQAEILANHNAYIEDIKRSYDGLGLALDMVNAKNTQAAAAETTNLAALKGRWSEAEDAAKTAAKNIESHKKLLAEQKDEALRALDVAYQVYQQDTNNAENKKKYIEALNTEAVERKKYAYAVSLLDEQQRLAIDKVTEAQNRYNDALDKSRTWVKGWGKDLSEAAKGIDQAWLSGGLSKAWGEINSDAFQKKLNDKLNPPKTPKARAEKSEQELANEEFFRGADARVKKFLADKERAESAAAKEALDKRAKEAKEQAQASYDAYFETYLGQTELAEKEKSAAQQWMEQYDSILDAQQNFESMMIGSFDSIANSLAQTLWGVDVDWKQTMKSMGVELTALLLKMLTAAALKAVITGATGGAAGGLGAALGAGLIGDLIVGGSFHSGGTVGAGGAPILAPAALWSGAPRFHGGLRPDEFPAILQTGEQVLSRREVAQGGRSGARSVVNNFNFPGVRDGRGVGLSIDQAARRMNRILHDEDAL